MRLATIRTSAGEVAAIVHPERGVASVSNLVGEAAGDVLSLVAGGRFAELSERADAAADDVFVPRESVTFAAPYRHPRKIWGIGLNYVDHAADLSEQVPEEPASFIKGDHTIIGPGDAIPVPRHSDRTTAEAELGLVIGKYCRDVSEAEALDHVFGVCLVLDQTAEDILERNPRFLTRSKNFPGFFSFGPEIVPLDEVRGSLADVEVSTVLNGAVHRTNTVAKMRYSPEFLVSFHSAVMPLYPGDIISTGTPGAARISPGDVAECRIPGIGTLTNPVVGSS
ncbi:fumarylacetoacetate hydrolase family protein [Prauserella cavernicola]|uniref:Fumarylacetoacetate hydrolase family protein n=1 Tax=Prauserella cavernicola TaxID=2800127 RepID=A0A934QUS9_9PSEU|nr:fumarylacetoacetate hydrolase family protein [Prauserella cavernicola]MBK1786004.1 fumarylacetoacetate hydrolase family protein [Prauserella cavernicola]